MKNHHLITFGGILLAYLLQMTPINQALFYALNDAFSLFPDITWQYVTIFGNAVIAMILVLPLIGHQRRILPAILIATLIGMITSQGLKQLLEIPRPPGVLDLTTFNIIGIPFKQYSFPSGHTTTIFIVVGVLSTISSLKPWFKWILAGAILIGLSRIAMGVHWPMDVLAGAFLGFWVGQMAIVIAAHFPRFADDRIVQTSVLIALISLAVIATTTYETYQGEALWFQRGVAMLMIVLAAKPVYEFIQDRWLSALTSG